MRNISSFTGNRSTKNSLTAFMNTTFSRLSVLLLPCILLGVAALVSCENEELPPPPQESPKTMVFKVPDDGLVSEEKMKLYVRASEGLLLVDRKWADTLTAADPSTRIHLLADLQSAQDAVCRELGLAGMDEYLWIDTVALQDIRNTAAAEAAGLKILRQ